MLAKYREQDKSSRMAAAVPVYVGLNYYETTSKAEIAN